MNCKIKKDGKEIMEIPYFQLESACEKLVASYLAEDGITRNEALSRHKSFLEYLSKYQTFSPYFDYVFTTLGYTLENPFMIPDSELVFLEKKDLIEYYAKRDLSDLSFYDRQFFENPIFISSCEDNILKEPLNDNFENIRDCFLDETGRMMSLKDVCEHAFMARLWLHNILIRDENVCKQYNKILEEQNILYYGDPSFLIIRSYHFIQLAVYRLMNHNNTMIVRYDESLISKIQKNILKSLKENKLLLDTYDLKLKKGGN